MKKNNRALSELISYVLLIVIAVGLAAGVYAWVKTLVPASGELKECPKSVSIIVMDYSCDSTTNQLSLTLQNKGNFVIDGFFIRATNESEKIPVVPLSSTDNYPGKILINNSGKYDFINSQIFPKFKPKNITTTHFNYGSLGQIKKIQIQPYVCDNRSVCRAIFLCDNLVNLDISSSSNCN